MVLSAVVLRVRSIPFPIHGCQILALNHENVELPQLLHIVQWKLDDALNFNTAVVAAIHTRNTAADLWGHKHARLNSVWDVLNAPKQIQKNVMKDNNIS